MDYLIVRLFSSFLVGALLSQAGSLIQLGTRNILASPSTLGIDGLSILWLLIFHSVSLYFNLNYPIEWTFVIGLPLFFLLGIIFPKFLSGQTKFERIILLGLTFNLFVGAIFSLWQFLFMAFNLPFPVELWFGHFRFASHSSLIILLSTEILILLGMKYYFKDLKMFSIGPIMGLNWGLDEKKLFRFIFVVVAISTLIVINLFGAFSFLGLIFPILARKMWFPKRDLAGELFLGPAFNGLCLMAVDFLCYFYPVYGAEVPVGLIVTGIGAVSLIIILWSSYKDSEIVAKPKK
ncbi:MAG: iron chelate uptake ABC transporter family permease subunit [Bdellovibrionales bacterium]|nr:iron chelate uptake ABC transporter family permease subunit [Bdellovibrionales bacterium]